MLLDPKDFNLNTLLQENQNFITQYKNNPLMVLIRSEKMRDKTVRQLMLDCIQVFSDQFQKVVMLRSVFCDNLKFFSVANEHLNEEFGHNLSLLKDRNSQPALWDPILESTSCWFAWKMLSLNDEEKTVLVHLVLEASANVFFQEAHKVMNKYGETNYFKIHAEADEAHENMGKELLCHISKHQLERLFSIQEKGWDVLNTTCARIARIVENGKFSQMPVIEYAA